MSNVVSVAVRIWTA